MHKPPSSMPRPDWFVPTTPAVTASAAMAACVCACVCSLCAFLGSPWASGCTVNVAQSLHLVAFGSSV
jgi:hypothetical protein